MNFKLKQQVRLITLFSLIFYNGLSFSQNLPLLDTVSNILNHPRIQYEVTLGVNDLYNFNFKRANSLFRWFQRVYPRHPLPYFLLGMSKWWEFIPGEDDKRLKKQLFAYMDTTISYAKILYKRKSTNQTEASFFLSIAYAVKANVNAEQGNWTSAINNSKKSLKYFAITRSNKDLSPELLLGDGLYDYFAVWIPENYPILKPVFWFFEEGDKVSGLKTLEEASQKSFYTRIEATYLLLRIYLNEQKNLSKAVELARYLHTSFPNNSYFQYYYAAALFSRGEISKLRQIAAQMLKRIQAGQFGYNDYISRYAHFYTAYSRSDDSTTYFFEKTVALSEKMKLFESNYYHYSLEKLGDKATETGNKTLAQTYFKKILRYSSRKKDIRKRAKQKIRKLR